jgi:hypothetical protein
MARAISAAIWLWLADQHGEARHSIWWIASRLARPVEQAPVAADQSISADQRSFRQAAL